jgi:hypothetical protein
MQSQVSSIAPSQSSSCASCVSSSHCSSVGVIAPAQSSALLSHEAWPVVHRPLHCHEPSASRAQPSTPLG